MSASPSASHGNLPSAPLRRAEWVALAVAVLWSAALLVAAASAPAYRTETATSSGTLAEGSRTLVEENGLDVLVVVGLPLLVTLAVGTALWRRRDRRGAGPVAWSLTAVLAGVNLLAMLSVGAFFVPVTACLAVACTLHAARQLARPGT